MGCDGGTIPRRDELVRVKKKAEKKDKDAEREFRWLHCALTQQRLQEPIVMCALGRLFSKQNIIERLLEKVPMPESCAHIKGLRDIKELKLTPNPAYKDDNKTEGSLDTRGAPYICKLMGLEMSGKFRFVALWNCGCVFSERALKEFKDTACPLCQTPYSTEDVIILNGNEEEVEALQAKVFMRNAKKKASKKSKSKDIVAPTSTVTSESTATATNENPTTSNGVEINKNISESNKTVDLSAKDVQIKNGHKVTKIKNVSQKRLAEKTLEDPDIKRLKDGYTVAADPKASNVYKSLFTSHSSEKQQDRAHWVTYNPFYN